MAVGWRYGWNYTSSAGLYLLPGTRANHSLSLAVSRSVRHQIRCPLDTRPLLPSDPTTVSRVPSSRDATPREPSSFSHLSPAPVSQHHHCDQLPRPLDVSTGIHVGSYCAEQAEADRTSRRCQAISWVATQFRGRDCCWIWLGTDRPIGTLVQLYVLHPKLLYQVSHSQAPRVLPWVDAYVHVTSTRCARVEVASQRVRCMYLAHYDTLF